MGKVVNFPSDDGKGKRKGISENQQDSLKRLSQETFLSLVEPLKRGLRKFYPSQVEDVLGVAGFGEENGNECFIMGLLVWSHKKQEKPIASTFLAVFINDELDKISFLEAKNNYWDWRLMLDTYQSRFNTKEMFEELQKLREQLLSGNLTL